MILNLEGHLECDGKRSPMMRLALHVQKSPRSIGATATIDVPEEYQPVMMHGSAVHRFVARDGESMELLVSRYTEDRYGARAIMLTSGPIIGLRAA